MKLAIFILLTILLVNYLLNMFAPNLADVWKAVIPAAIAGLGAAWMARNDATSRLIGMKLFNNPAI